MALGGGSDRVTPTGVAAGAGAGGDKEGITGDGTTVRKKAAGGGSSSSSGDSSSSSNSSSSTKKPSFVTSACGSGDGDEVAIGGLVLRGNRCVLVRSLEGLWEGDTHYHTLSIHPHSYTTISICSH